MKIGPKEQQLRDMRGTPRHHQMMIDDGAPPCLLRNPGEKRPPVAVASPVFADEKIAADTAKVGGRTPDDEERSIRREADARWRNWVVNAKELSRPTLAAFVRRVRKERADAAKAARRDEIDRGLAARQAARQEQLRKVEPAPPAMPAADNQERTVKKKSTKKTARKVKTKKTRAAKPRKTAARSGGFVEPTAVGDFMCRDGGATMPDLVKKFGIEAHPMRTKIMRARQAGYKIEYVGGIYRGTAPSKSA